MAARLNTPSYNKATSLLKTGRLREALVFLCNIRHTYPGSQFIADKAQTLLDDLDRLLDHFAKGGADAMRSELVDRVAHNAWQLTEDLYDLETAPVSTAHHYDLAETIDALLAHPLDDAMLNTAFEQVCNSRLLSRDDRNALSLALLDESLPMFVRATLLSAITLYLMQRFDEELTEQLYVYTFDDQPVQMQMQAWVTLVLVALAHNDRIAHLPRLREQYRLMCEQEPELLFDIQITLLQCRECLNADKRMHDIVLKIDTDEAEQDNSEQLKEFFAFIAEGLDLSIKLFKQQARLPFFSHADSRHHWLQPFSIEQPDIKDVYDQNPKAQTWIKIMMQSVAQCETDKYAHVLSLNELGDGRLISKLGEKIEQSGIKVEEVMPLPPLYVMRNYLHDLYRYCLLHPKAKELRCQPFDLNLKMCMNPWLRPVTADTNKLAKVAELLLHHEHWHEASQVYELLTKADESEANLQRLAYACLKANERDAHNEQQALHHLRRCHYLYPNSLWTVKLMADILHDTEDYVAEEIVLREALTLRADDPKLLLRMGRSLNAQQRYQEALEPLFKADFLKEGQRNVQHQLCFSLFALKDFERAQRYATKAMSHSNAEWENFALGAQVALLSGDVTRAIELFMQAGVTESILSLDRNRELLLKLGIDDLTIDLIREVLGKQKDKEKTNKKID